MTLVRAHQWQPAERARRRRQGRLEQMVQLLCHLFNGGAGKEIAVIFPSRHQGRILGCPRCAKDQIEIKLGVVGAKVNRLHRDPRQIEGITIGL